MLAGELHDSYARSQNVIPFRSMGLFGTEKEEASDRVMGRCFPGTYPPGAARP